MKSACENRAAKSHAFRRLYAKDKLTIGSFVPLESFDGDLAKQEEMVKTIQTADEHQFAGLWFQDIGLRDDDFGDTNTRYESFLYLTYLMAFTKQVVFGTASTVLPFRHPLRLAKEVTTIDQLSGGRFILGLSSGDRPYDFPAFGVDPSARAELFRETYDFYQKLITPPYEEIVTRLGYVRSGKLITQPLSLIPQMVVGFAQQSIDWIAQHGDGWMYYPRDPSTQSSYIEQFRAAVERQAPGVFKPFGQPVFLDLSEDPDEAPTPIRLGYRTGTTFLLEHLERLRQVGVNHVVLRLVPNGRPMREVIEEIGEVVVPHFPPHE